MSAERLPDIWRGVAGLPVPAAFTRVNFANGTQLEFIRDAPDSPGIYIWQSEHAAVEHLAEVALRDGVLMMRMLKNETDWMPVAAVRDCFWAHVADITLNSEP